MAILDTLVTDLLFLLFKRLLINTLKKEKYPVFLIAKITIKSVEKKIILLDFIKKKGM